MASKWFYFDQNNSGGSFDHDPDRGIGYGLFIQANDQRHAIDRAEEIGLYFNGVDDGRDCPCCGDRWHSSYMETGENPIKYGKEWRTVKKGESPTLQWGIPLYIHPLSGGFYEAIECAETDHDEVDEPTPVKTKTIRITKTRIRVKF